LTIQEYKDQGNWPLSWISGKGLVPVINELADKLNRNVTGLEIGICRGENIVYFLENCDKLEKIHCIDPYLPYMDWVGPITQEDMDSYHEIAIKNFSPNGDKIVVHKDTSDNCVDKFEDGQFDYIFIDGDHSFDGVMKDLKNYYSKVKSGGIFSGHDINLIDVQRALRDFRIANNIDSEIKFTDVNVWYWIK